VSHIDNLEFLADVIPKTTTYKQFKEKKAKDVTKQNDMEKGQRTLNGNGPASNGAMPEETASRLEGPKQSPTVPRTPVVPVSVLIANQSVGDSADHDPDIEMKD